MLPDTMQSGLCKENPTEISYQISKSRLYHKHLISFFKNILKFNTMTEAIPRNSSNLEEIVQLSCHL